MFAAAPPLGEELWSALVLSALALACLAGRRIAWLGRLISGEPRAETPRPPDGEAGAADVPGG